MKLTACGCVCICGVLMWSACQRQIDPPAPKITKPVPKPDDKANTSVPVKVAPVTKARPKVKRPDPTTALPKLKPRDKKFRRGVSLGLFASTKDTSEQRKIYAELLDEIEAVGATDLSIVVRWTQNTVKDSKIARDPKRTVADETLKWVIKEAQARKLRVFLMPIIHLNVRKIGVWRGTIEPVSPDKWWANYEAFIVYYAKLAQKTGVSLFAVGSELLSMETKTKRWHKLIKRVRRIYKGQLTYSANWDHFEVVSFWDKLDVVGMTAYQELTKRPNPSLKQLKRGWLGFSQRLRVWSMQHGHRYIFTEVGYPSHSKGAAYPWDYRPRGKADPMLQARAYRALMEVWSKDKSFDGLYVWNWFGFKSLQDRGYTPRGKPAEKVIKHWFDSTKKKETKKP